MKKLLSLVILTLLCSTAFASIILREQQGPMVIELQKNHGTAQEPSWAVPTAWLTPAVEIHLKQITGKYAIIVWNPGGQIVRSTSGDKLQPLLDQFNIEVINSIPGRKMCNDPTLLPGEKPDCMLKFIPGKNRIFKGKVR